MAIPRHVAIIIDGNRRWAVRRGLSKLEGHRYGAETLKRIVPVLIERGVEVASIYTFSRENWRRTQEEVSAIMGLIESVFREEFDPAEFHKQGTRVRVSGRREDFPDAIQRIFTEVTETTKNNDKFILNFCLSYGGRDELAHAARLIAEEAVRNPATAAGVDEDAVARRLYTAGLPDVDLLIRTGGEQRLSGFLPWHTTYAELYFTDVLWPDFTERDLDAALIDFSGRKRNFGA